MPLTLHELLQPQVIVDTISKISVGRGLLSQFMGFAIGSGGIQTVDTRYASFRIYNLSRQPATFRAPNTGPATVPPNPVGEQKVAMARMHEKIPLEAESLGNLALIGGPNSQIDSMGQDYIKRQQEFLAGKFNMSIEILTAGFLRGQLYLEITGDNWEPKLSTPSGNYVTIDFLLPSGNKSQLDMLGAGSIIDQSWDNPAANIVLHLLKIRAASVQLTGMPITQAVVNSTTWFHIVNNTSVRTLGGVVQSPWESFTYEETKDANGKPLAAKGSARLRAVPWLEWIIIDDVISVGGQDPVNTSAPGDGTLTKVVPDNVVGFMPTPDRSWCQMWNGSELISEDYGKPMQLKRGFQAWSSYSIEPTAISIVALLNALPVPYREKAWAYATVVF